MVDTSMSHLGFRCIVRPPAQARKERQMADKPNILVIWGDDIGITNLSCYSDGLMGYRTPNIDRLANEGMLFTDCYGEQSCTAGRASFITGQSVLPHGPDARSAFPAAPVGLQAEDPTIAELLKNHGYATGQFGKNHLGDLNEYLPTVHGFDEFFGNLYHLNAEEEPEDRTTRPKTTSRTSANDSARAVCCTAGRRTRTTRPSSRAGAASASSGSRTPARSRKKRMETCDDEFVEAAKDFIKRQHNGGQAVLLLGQHHPHAPVHAHQAGERRAGRPLAVALPRHDDRPRQERRRAARRCSTSSASPTTRSSCTAPTTGRT